MFIKTISHLFVDLFCLTFKIFNIQIDSGKNMW